MTKNKKLKVIPLGGLGEIGKNITVLEYNDDIIIIDCGLAFPDDEMLGIDLVIPDFTYLVKNADRVKGLFITHGHEDHIGSIPYLLKQLNVPVYGTKLTLGILERKLMEHGLLRSSRLKTVSAGSVITQGVFSVEFVTVNHSIPDACALSIKTPVGTVFHTGDYKIDSMPIAGDMIDLPRIAEIGRKGVLLMLSDSTNVERPGYTAGERIVGDALEKIFKKTDKRIIIATFASNVHRLQQIINASVKTGRKVVINGRSMENVLSASAELGYLDIPNGTLISVDEMSRYKQNQITIITTGSQGEPMSALSRMAFSEHRKINVTQNDLIVLSASPIPGNEKLISRVVNELFRKGADVIYEHAGIHVSGHACQEELKLMYKLLKPRFFAPVHGEYRHLILHARLVESMGHKPSDVFIMDIGKGIELDRNSCKPAPLVPSGKILVDGLGVGDVGNIVLRDRKHLAEDGLIIVVVAISTENKMVVSGPDIISRGFVYVRESEELMDQVRAIAKKSLDKSVNKKSDWNTIKATIKSDMNEFLFEKTKRRPMILPIIMEM